MRVTITTPGKFPPAFHAARYHETRGELARIISPVPYERTSQFGVSRERSASLTPLGVWNYGVQTYGPRSVQRPHQLLFSAAFDEIAAHMIGDSDVVNCWCSTALRTIRAAHARGIPAVLEVASAHVATQSRLLREEGRRWGTDVDRAGLESGVIDRTVAEYDEADRIIVPSSFVRRTFVEQGVPGSKIAVLPYGIDATPTAMRREHDGPPRILFVGGATLRKGIPYLIEAFRLLQFDAALRIVGARNEALFQRLGGLPKGAVATGPKAGADLALEYASADIFVLPSIEDGYGLVAAEAMSAGVPVIVSDRAGASELVQDGVNGFVVPAGDSGALAALINDLLADPDRRRRMGANARATARSRTWDAYGDDRYERVYAPLLGLRSREVVDAAAA